MPSYLQQVCAVLTDEDPLPFTSPLWPEIFSLCQKVLAEPDSIKGQEEEALLKLAIVIVTIKRYGPPELACHIPDTALGSSTAPAMQGLIKLAEMRTSFPAWFNDCLSNTLLQGQETGLFARLYHAIEAKNNVSIEILVKLQQEQLLLTPNECWELLYRELLACAPSRHALSETDQQRLSLLSGLLSPVSPLAEQDVSAAMPHSQHEDEVTCLCRLVLKCCHKAMLGREETRQALASALLSHVIDLSERVTNLRKSLQFDLTRALLTSVKTYNIHRQMDEIDQLLQKSKDSIPRAC